VSNETNHDGVNADLGRGQGPSAGLPKPNDIQRLFGRRGALIGMIHLRPLPGSPHYDEAAGVEAVCDQALREGRLLEAGGFDAILVENGGDVPFLPPSKVGPETVAALAVATRLLRSELKVPVGVNCLANAVDVSLAVALAAGGTFVRANQWVNAYVANEGLIEGQAGVVARYRRSIGAGRISVWADVQVKLGSHSITADRSLAEQARDAEFFDADALIVTGRRLADPPLFDDVEMLRASSSLALIVGSGVDKTNVARLLGVADAAIVGSALKVGGVWWGEMSREAVEAISEARGAIRSAASH
jgi:membrane complex biogenesis BtpA family protein